MRDMPLFTTENGVASLTLNQIPYTKSAWIRIQDSVLPAALLEECIVFCRAAGAEHIFATGDVCCEAYPEHTKILKMQADTQTIGETDAALFPVTEKTLDYWRTVYNGKIQNVPNGAWMTMEKAKEMLEQGSGYFVHRDGILLGTGMVQDSQIAWVASLATGAGADVVRALCHAVTTDKVTLEVASANLKAVKLYEELGFVPTELIAQWYRIK